MLPRTDAPAPADTDAFEALFRHAPCGYLTAGDDGRITRVNDTFLAWAGYRREDLLGTAFGRLLPVGDRILWSTHSAPQLLSTGGVSEVVVEVVGADRTRRPALVSATRVPARGGADAELRIIVFAAPERRAHERELIAALHRLEESEDRRSAAAEEARRRALLDALTGLPNRAGAVARLTGALEVPGGPVAVLVVDLDHFHAVNESLGRAAGDELLLAVARRLGDATRDGAVVARLSADEFAVVDRCDGTDAARSLAERLLDVLAEPVVVAGLELVTSASIGVAVADPGAASAERVLHDADVAVQRAKARGRQRVEVHDPTRTDAGVDRLRLLGELRRGIAAGELRLHHQPLVRLADGGLCGVEALVRWQHPVRGLLPPSEFIELAERSGLVRELGAWVLEAAVEQAAAWARDAEMPDVEVSVNLSARQLTDPALVGTVTAALARHGLDPRLLVLEVTETALVNDPDVAAAALAALKGLGIGIAVDDFGTGYASLTYLQQFPVDELKIDRSFVSGLGTSDGDSAIVTTCVQLAHAVGVRAVAEGVETQAQRDALRDMGCDVGQGYLFSRPVDADALREWVVGRRA
ncbi:hypothetical protein GCM10023225_01800 [Kineococcus glutinatus]|uniref:PAS domain S-box-containing protein/diguanylate cyclase (GGDEF)-like protein n=1 Tax=Kineococcus glutinatus TaxID=1070872 RepID=A0ABP9H6L0_9ACTN